MSKLLPTLRNPLDFLRENVSETFDRFLPRSMRTDERHLWPSAMFEGGPAIDVTEDEENVHVTAELPGMDRKDFTIEVTDSRLILRGEKKESREETKRTYCYSECRYGSFSRTIMLPAEVDADHARANHKDGVLSITLPKTGASKGKRIQVIESV